MNVDCFPKERERERLVKTDRLKEVFVCVQESDIRHTVGLTSQQLFEIKSKCRPTECSVSICVEAIIKCLNSAMYAYLFNDLQSRYKYSQWSKVEWPLRKENYVILEK